MPLASPGPRLAPTRLCPPTRRYTSRRGWDHPPPGAATTASSAAGPPSPTAQSGGTSSGIGARGVSAAAPPPSSYASASGRPSSYARVHGEVSREAPVWLAIPSVAREQLEDVKYCKARGEGIAKARARDPRPTHAHSFPVRVLAFGVLENPEPGSFAWRGNCDGAPDSAVHKLTGLFCLKP